MKISNSNTTVQLNAYLKQVRQQQQQPAKEQQQVTQQDASGDKVELSSQAKEMLNAAKSLKAMPDVREEKVEQVKLEVENGTYKVPAPKIATDMLQEAFQNNLAMRKMTP